MSERAEILERLERQTQHLQEIRTCVSHLADAIAAFRDDLPGIIESAVRRELAGQAGGPR